MRNREPRGRRHGIGNLLIVPWPFGNAQGLLARDYSMRVGEAASRPASIRHEYRRRSTWDGRSTGRGGNNLLSPEASSSQADDLTLSLLKEHYEVRIRNPCCIGCCRVHGMCGAGSESSGAERVCFMKRVAQARSAGKISLQLPPEVEEARQEADRKRQERFKSKDRDLHESYQSLIDRISKLTPSVDTRLSEEVKNRRLQQLRKIEAVNKQHAEQRRLARKDFKVREHCRVPARRRRRRLL